MQIDQPAQTEDAQELPQEVLDMITLQKERIAQRVEEIGAIVAKKRDEAVKGRAASGIEDEWIRDEEAYQGIDDANRDTSKGYKPSSISGTPTFQTRKQDGRSRIYLNITRPYTDAAAARVGDMLLPTDDRNWAIKPTPIPELAQWKDSQEPAFDPQGQRILRPPRAEEMGMPPANPMMPGQQPEPQMGPSVPATMGDVAEKKMEEAQKRAEKAEKRIDDWLVECQYHAEMRKAIEDCSRLGSGIMKGPVPVKRKMNSVVQKDGTLALTMEIKTCPASKRVDPWNFCPDPACGESIQDGQYVVERDFITGRKLKDLKGLPGYLSDQIDKVLEEGPEKRNLEGSMNPARQKQSGEEDNYKIWYFTGLLDQEDLESLGVDTEGSTLESIPAVVTLVNDRAIKASLTPLDDGEFPYDVLVWQRRSGIWAGAGVPFQIRAAQDMLNAAARNMLDNSGVSGGPMVGIRQNAVQPMDGDWTIRPRKMFWIKEDADIRSISDAISAILIPSNQVEMTNIIQFALKFAEDATGLPMIMQGQQGKAPDTVGGMEIVNNNASTVLRRIARNYDDSITEPHIRRYYAWLMKYGDESEKGDYQIDARGSTALVERSLQNQAIMQMGQMVMNPAFGLSPSKWIVEAMKSQKLDPKRFEMSDEEKQKLSQQPPPVAPQIEAAKIRAEAQVKTAEMANETAQKKVQLDTDRDRTYVQAETQRTEAEHEARMQELAVKRELAMLEYANTQKVTLDQIKADLAKESMRLNTQKELAGADHALKAAQVATPGTEPPGRAPAGKAFQA